MNCGSRNAHCSISKVEIVSLVFIWLIILGLAIKCVIKHTQGAKNTVSTHPRQVILSVGQVSVSVSVSSCLLIQRTSKHLGHNSSAHFSVQAIKRVCAFSSFQLAQRTSRVKSGTRKTEDSLAHWTSHKTCLRFQFFPTCPKDK